MHEHHMAGRVSWAVQHLQGLGAERYRVTVEQPAVRLERLRVREVGHLTPFGQFVDPKPIGLVGALNRDTQLLAQHIGDRAVIHMAVSQEDFLDLAVELRPLLLPAPPDKPSSCAAAARMRCVSPPGSTMAILPVCAHLSTEQFC